MDCHINVWHIESFNHKMSNRWHYTIRNVAGISACTQMILRL